ncbi:DMT family transporter [Alicyclobacillus tolerans]|uniref:DMT family transporter n=1 Tax=Alicyclobacillus tolerans TaxID=90970 RepID=UPI001F3A9713|nr:DMT family transporter [Alicyclobacillus tolerans]MCF8566579.1 DMT family transporter [Alicyclobacillus tolerans]
MKRWVTELGLFSVVIIWGINYTINKFGLVQLSPAEFNEFRFLGTAPVLFLLTFLFERSLRISRRDIVRLLGVSVLGVSVYNTMFSVAVKYTSVTNLSLLIAMSPIFSSLFAALMKQEKFTWKMQIGSAVAFVGAALVLLAGHLTSAHYPHALAGDLVGLFDSVIWGIYPVLTAPLFKKYTPLRVTSWSMAIGAVSLVLYNGIVVRPVFPVALWNVTWMSLLYSILFVTAYGMVVWYLGVERIGTTKAMVYMYLVPAAAVSFAAIANHERVYAGQVAGGVLILLGLSYIKGLHTFAWLHMRKTLGKKVPLAPNEARQQGQ